MSFASNYEFPNTSFYDSDLRELIKLMTELQASYESILSTVTALNTQVQELSAKVDNLYNYVDEKVAAAVSAATADLRSQIAALQENFETLQDNVTTFESNVNTRFANERIITNNDIAALKVYTDLQIEAYGDLLAQEISAVNKRIDDLQIALPKIYNPVNGDMESIQTTVNSTYNALRVHGLSNSEYGALGISNDEYANKILSNIDYAARSEIIFTPKGFYNPITGVRDTVANIASWIFTYLLTTALTNEQYVSADLTNDDYIALNITNIQYVTNGVTV